MFQKWQSGEAVGFVGAFETTDDDRFSIRDGDHAADSVDRSRRWQRGRSTGRREGAELDFEFKLKVIVFVDMGCHGDDRPRLLFAAEGLAADGVDRVNALKRNADD